ncbi:MAG: glycosyltransferase family 4 protein [Candidatus Omnitrophica bacterium]|nr:glycosyltransferase family 4 protein [Candidatus Omnitrophota bacterium]
MKILLIHPHDIYSPNEPWTIRIVSLAREFRSKGHQVRLAYAPLEVREAKRSVELEGVELITLTRKAGLGSLFANIKKIKKCAEWADIIHFQKCFHYIAIPALVSGFLLDKPLHYDWDDWEEKIWYHSNRESMHTAIFGNFVRILERFLPVLADTVSVASKKLGDLCIGFGVRPCRIFKAPVGADLRRFSPLISGERIKRKYHLENSRVVLYLGQLHAGQYVDMFIQAANAVLHKQPDAVFWILGQGYMEHHLRQAAIDYGIEDKVFFMGSVPHDLIPQYIGAADICVACFEDNEVTVCKSPLKIVEYLASGKAIVASLVGETRNMVGGAGFLVEPGDYHSLADAIVNVLRNPRLEQELGQRARLRAERRYNWENTAGNIIRAYETAIALHKNNVGGEI